MQFKMLQAKLVHMIAIVSFTSGHDGTGNEPLCTLPLQDTLFGEERAGYLDALRQTEFAGGREEPLDGEDAQGAEERGSKR